MNPKLKAGHQTHEYFSLNYDSTLTILRTSLFIFVNKIPKTIKIIE